MNDITQILYVWLSNTDSAYTDIMLYVDDYGALQSYVESSMNLEWHPWQGILHDMLNLVNWRDLYDAIKSD